MKLIIIFCSLVFIMNLRAEVGGDRRENGIFKLNLKAEVAGTKGEGGNFKLTDKSIQHLGVNFQTISGNGPWKITSDAIVKIKKSTGVYRRFEGELTFVIVTLNKVGTNEVLIKSDDLQEGDEIAISNVSFLRMAENDLNSDTVDNCAH